MQQKKLQTINTNGVQLRCVVEGQGPLVILLHGFPQCWYLWRHQIDPIVAAGFQVAVPDQRGYGASSSPPNIEDFNIKALCGDVAGLAEALGHKEFIVVGHDWGCIVAWNTALLHESACRAVMGLAVPGWRFGSQSINPPGMDDRFWYIRYFQTPGVAEREFESDLRRNLYHLYYNVAADAPRGAFMQQLAFARSASMAEVFPAAPVQMPRWMTEQDLDYYVKQFTTSGLRGPLNWYRNIPTNNALTPELDGKKISQPAAFVAGRADPVLEFDPGWRDKLIAQVPDLRFTELIDGAGHWLQIEQPGATTAQILRFLRQL